MLDPVTGFEYPKDWVTKCQSPEKLPLVERGLAVLTASGAVLVRGFTTGTTAAAACKAAVLSLGSPKTRVCIQIPCGLSVEVPVESSFGKASCRKFAGDYPADMTAGLKFSAEATPQDKGIELIPGDGIGRFSRNTPRYPKGSAAISPPARDCINASIREALDRIGLSGVKVSLHVPEGAEVAKKTLNTRVGVEGGISILGTTGLVEPWDDHLTESVLGRIAGTERPVLTTGRIGLRFSRLLFPDREVILAGGKIGEALAAAHGEVVLAGLPALILKFINPHLLEGTGFGTVEELAGSPEFGAILQHNLARFKMQYPLVRVILVDRQGSILGGSP
ncbi:MAG: Cobalt-precorrin-5B C(1)-methyltransferase [Methanoregula sp. SKADARSKE-2]|nr:MAG: Cobalt-precorrin-5B C(1)-methyltransferase [Methanoregula sp. SKADARSKE-2]